MTSTRPDLIRTLVTALRLGGVAADWRDVADIAWLTRSGWTATPREPYPQPFGPPPDPDEATPGPPLSADPPLPTQPMTVASHPAPIDLEPPEPAAEASYIVTADSVNAAAATNVAAMAPRRFALPHRRELERSLRPLKRRYRTSRRRELDLDATIDHFCESGVLAPVLQQAWEPWLDLSLVVDASPTMVIWRETAEVFGDLLERSGTFRNVRRWSMDAGASTLRLSSGTATLRPEEVTTPSGRHLVLVLTDGVGELWSRDPIWRALSGWGRSSPTAIVQLLRRGPASRTALGDPGVTVRTATPGTPSSRLRFDQPWWAFEEISDVVPVVTLTADDLLRWAYFLAGSPGGALDAVSASPPAAAAEPAHSRGAWLRRLDDGKLREVLNTGLSPRAHRLAVLLSAIDPTIDLTRIIMEKLVPEAELSDLAELLVMGVLETDGDRLVYQPAAHTVFSEFLGATDAMSVWIAAAPHLAATGRPSPLALVLGEGTETGQVDSLRIPAAIVERLGIGRRRSSALESTPISAAPQPPVAEPPPLQVLPHLEAPEVVAPGVTFELVVGLSAPAGPRIDLGPVSVPEPSRIEELVVQLVAEGFSIETARHSLPFDRADVSAATITIPVMAPEVSEPWRGRIGVEYSHHGLVVGTAWREILVTSQATEPTRSPTVANEMAIDLAASTTIDLTVSIRRGEAGDSLWWTFVSPHAVTLPDEQVVTQLRRDTVAVFAQRKVRELGQVDGSPSARFQVAGIATEVATIMPGWFWRVLGQVWRIAKDADRLPTLLFVSQESAVPWELAATDEDFVPDRTLTDPEAPQLLGAQVIMGRWLPPGSGTPFGGRSPSASPAETMSVDSLVVMVGEFDARTGWRPLKDAIDEGRELTARYPSVWLKADEANVTALLSGQLTDRGRPVRGQVLHIVSHGEVDPDLPMNSGVILSDSRRRLNESMVAHSDFTRATAPLVFLNCSQLATPASGALVEGGLAAAFIREGARAFIAPLWNVNDTLAKDVALTFYEETLAKGRRVGEVMRELRARFSTAFPDRDQTTPLAYVLYGHPNLRLRPAFDEPRPAEAPPAESAPDYQALVRDLGFATVQEFQRSVGLTTDGLVGPSTRAALLDARDSTTESPEAAGQLPPTADQLAYDYFTRGEYAEAEAHYEQALGTSEAAHDQSSIGVYRHQLGLIAYYRKDYDAARAHYEHAIDALQQVPDHSGVATCYGRLGQVAHAQGDFDRAALLYQRALDLDEQIKDREGMATDHHRLGLLAQDRGDYEAARSHYEHSLALDEQLEKGAGIATNRYQLGTLAELQGDFHRALDDYVIARDVRLQLGHHEGAAPTLTRICNVLGNLGRYQEAIEAAEEAVTLYRALAQQRPDAFTPDLAMTLNNLANRYSDVGRRREAITPAEEAVTLYRALAQQSPDAFTPDLAMALNNLGIRYSDLRRHEQALPPTEESVMLYRELATTNPVFVPDLAMSLTSLGNRYRDLGRLKEALAPTEEAAALTRASPR